MGSFVFKWPHPDANEVYVTGTFDDWGKTQKLNKVGDTWEKEVELPSADLKYLYKFVVDEKWTTDHTAPQQDDGHFNVNNVLTPERIIKKEGTAKHDASSVPGAAFISSAAPTSTTAALAGQVPKEGESANGTPTISSAAPDSTTAGLAGQVPKESESIANAPTMSSAAPDSTTATLAGQVQKETTRDSVPGAFPETPANEPDSFAIAPIPASSGTGNPVSLQPGEKVPEHSEVTSHTLSSNITSSKEDYEKAGDKSEKTFGVAPIPASEGVGNPINLQPGEKMPDQGDVSSNTVDSTVTTSKEDYENAGSSALPIIGGAGAALGLGAASAAVFSKDEDKKNLIPESSLPMGEAAKNTTDIGPTMSSAAPESTATALAASVPLEKKRQAMIIDPDDAPSTDVLSEDVRSPSDEITKEIQAVDKELLSKVAPSEAHGEPASAANAQTSYYGLPTAVPKPVEESMQKAHASPEAAADSSMVAEKSALEKELLSKVPSTDGAGDPAPTIAAATSPTAPGATEAAKSASVPGTSSVVAAAAAVSDGAGEEGKVEAPKTTAPTETTEGDATATAISDGTEDPTLAEEPAVKMMNQNEADAAPTTDAPAPVSDAPADDSTTTPSVAPVVAQPAETTSKVVDPAAAGAATTTTPSSATTTPKKMTTESAISSPAASATKDKKKKHRVSGFFKKIFN